MYEIIEWIIDHRGQPLTWGLVLSFILLIIDKLGRRLITSQVKRLFHINDKNEFREIAKRQARIEAKVDMLLRERGIQWDANGSNGCLADSAVKNGTYSTTRLPVNTIAPIVGRFIISSTRRMINMWKNLNKGILVPVLSFVAMVIKEVSGYQLPDGAVDMAADIILLIISFIGLFMNVTKPKSEPMEDHDDHVVYHHDAGGPAV